jgi:hypothetical protein
MNPPMDWDLPMVFVEDDPLCSFLNTQEECPPSSPKSPITDDKRLKRLARNRESARTSRRRKKQKVQYLESRIAQLSEEAATLRKTATLPKVPDTPFFQSRQQLFAKLSAALANSTTSDEVIEGILDELRDQVGATGKTRVETLIKTFQQTMDMMIPMHVKFFLWVCGADGVIPGAPQWSDLAKVANLTEEQVGSIQEYQGILGHERAQLMDCFESLKRMINKIVRHSKSLHSLMDEMRLFLKPRQIGHFFLWLAKYHPDLETEQVLASSTAVLKSE